MSTVDLCLLFLKDLPKYLFAVKPYKTKVDGNYIFAHPRSAVYATLKEVFVDEIYKPKKILKNVNVVIDLGTYIGDFSIWANKYFNPKKIIAIEAKHRLYLIAKKNMKINGLAKKVSLHNLAIFNKKTFLMNSSVFQDNTATFFKESKTGSVKTTTLADLIIDNKLQKIDYLKMDIEGGEKFVFTNKNKSIFKNKVRFISYETHELWEFGKREANTYLKSLGFKIIQIGSRGDANQFEAYNSNFE